MKKVFWTAASAVALLAAIACSSSKGSGGLAFNYSGPSCPSGQPATTTAVSQACITCAENACSSPSENTCVNSTCSAYYTCYCACAATDTTCQGGCRQSSDCMTCEATLTDCFTTAVTGSCSSQCGFDAGVVVPVGDGAAATGTCATLSSCCANLGSTASECEVAAGTNDQTACAAVLSGFMEAGVCH